VEFPGFEALETEENPHAMCEGFAFEEDDDAVMEIRET
jgi:hypothetical protein